MNLFVAIIVESFIGRSEAFKLPVQPGDFDLFEEEWKKFDPDATGFIDIEDLDQLLINLSNLDCNIFKECSDCF